MEGTDSSPSMAVARYGRQMMLEEFFAEKVHEKFSSGKALVVGAGGIGSSLLQYLAGAGVSNIGIIDGDLVDISNIHRQTIHSTRTVGLNKAVSAAERCIDLNPTIVIETYPYYMDKSNAIEIINKYDVVADATDTLKSKLLVNDAAVLCRKPLVSGSALRFDGQLLVLNFDGGPCYRCLFPNIANLSTGVENVTSCDMQGVLGPVPGLIGCLQAIEVLKIIGGLKNRVLNCMQFYDGLENEKPFRSMKMRKKNPNCECNI